MDVDTNLWDGSEPIFGDVTQYRRLVVSSFISLLLDPILPMLLAW